MTHKWRNKIATNNNYVTRIKKYAELKVILEHMLINCYTEHKDGKLYKKNEPYIGR